MNEPVRIVIECTIPLDLYREDGDDQANTPWSLAAEWFDHASGWNSQGSYRIVEPTEPEGEHHYGVVLNSAADRLWCWKHGEWESSSAASTRIPTP